jgi:hypothetical protein
MIIYAIAGFKTNPARNKKASIQQVQSALTRIGVSPVYIAWDSHWECQQETTLAIKAQTD